MDTVVAPRSRVRSTVRVTAVLGLVGFVVHLNSERAYWFYSPGWFGPRVLETLTLAGFYAVAVGLALWALARTPYRGWHQVVLAGAVFAWTVEGVIVHVLHEAGPLDLVFPAMFAGWHGLLSFAGFFFLVRKLLVEGRPGALAAWAGLYGAVAGSWAITSWLPDADPVDELAAAVPPADFAATLLLVVAALAAAHLLLDRAWDPEWRPGRVLTWLIVGGTAALAATGFATVPFGPVRYGVLVAVPLAALLLPGRRDEGPALFAELAGRVRVRHLVALLPAALVSTLIYTLAWDAGIGDDTLVAVRDLHVLGQVVVGGGVLTWALCRAFRLRRRQLIRSVS